MDANLAHVAGQVDGDVLVPLSHAICCRPCLPEELPRGSDHGRAIAANDKPVGVVSTGCHNSTSSSPKQMTCEAPGTALVTGGCNWLIGSLMDACVVGVTRTSDTPWLLQNVGVRSVTVPLWCHVSGGAMFGVYAWCNSRLNLVCR